MEEDNCFNRRVSWKSSGNLSSTQIYLRTYNSTATKNSLSNPRLHRFSLIFTTIQYGTNINRYQLPFIDEDTGVQRGAVTCPRRARYPQILLWFSLSFIGWWLPVYISSLHLSCETLSSLYVSKRTSNSVFPKESSWFIPSSLKSLPPPSPHQWPGTTIHPVTYVHN